MQNEEVIFEDSLHKDNEMTAELRKTFPTAVVYFDHCQKKGKSFAQWFKNVHKGLILEY